MNCPICGGEGVELGALGMLLHLKCRDCGMMFSERVPASRMLLRRPRSEKQQAKMNARVAARDKKEGER